MEKKKDTFKIVILSLVLIIVIALIVNMVKQSGVLTYKETPITVIRIDRKKETKTEEKEIKDETVKKDISEKVSEILSFGEDVSSEEIITYSFVSGYALDKNKTYVENVEAGKLYTALKSLDVYKSSNFKRLTQSDIESLPARLKSDYDTEILLQLDAQTIEKKYKSIFGGQIVNGDVKGCPSYYYDSTNSKYYSYSECGGTAYPTILAHKDSYTKVENKVEVVISIATFVPVDDNGISNKIYKGVVDRQISDSSESNDNLLYTKDLYKSDKFEENAKAEIESNYEKYAKYKMTFKLDENNNYIYESLEKI